MRTRPRLAAFVAIAALLTGCLSLPGAGGSATPSPSAPDASDDRSAAATPVAPSDEPASLEPVETPSPDPALLELAATTCPGGVVLEWTPSTHQNFHHYTGLRSPEEEIAPDYPPIAPAVDWGETYATDPFVTSAIDSSILPSERTWFYRVMAYDILNGVVSASPVRSARIDRVAALGTPEVTADDGGTRLAWEPFTGGAECFSSYRLMFGSGRPPNTVLSVVSDQEAASAVTDALHGGATYQLRVDAVRSTTLGDLVVGRSETVFYTVP